MENPQRVWRKKWGIDTNTVCRWVRYQRELEAEGIIGSMSKSGCPYDNSCMESFFASMKKECTNRKEYATMESVKQEMFRYIEMFYNRKRLHSSLGYMSPVAYRLKNQKGQVA